MSEDEIDTLLAQFLHALDALQDAQNRREWADYDERRLRARHVVSQLRVQQAAVASYEAALEHDRTMKDLRVAIMREQAKNKVHLDQLGEPDETSSDDVAEDTSWWEKTKAALKGKN